MTRAGGRFGIALVVAACARAPAEQRDGARPSPGPPNAPAISAPASDPSAPPPGRTPEFSEITQRYATTPFGPSEVVVLVPKGASDSARLPVLVAFHGRGESLKGPHLGARGWVDDYAVGHAVQRLGGPPLRKEDLQGFVTTDRLAAMNRKLSESPYRGLILVCPFLPDGLHGARMLEEGRALAHFVVDDVLPRVFRETPALGTPRSTGVDGVSLGGRAALLVGLTRPEAFGAVGALQPAIDEDEASTIADLAREAHGKNGALSLRLLTSDGDFFLEPTVVLGRALESRGIAHHLDVVSGPHSYEFNRGPGAFEMLLFHDRALRGLSP